MIHASSVTELSHPRADVRVEEIGEGRRRVTVSPREQGLFVPVGTCETRYPVALIERMLEHGSPAYLCSEIVREESELYLRLGLRNYMLSYVDERELDGARILDYGCGAGASTMVLARMFPRADVVGLGHDAGLLTIASERARHLERDATFVHSPSRARLPRDLGSFDHVVLSGAYEHLLPAERRTVMPELWAALRPGGVLFVNQTPNRLYPLEAHSTNLPLVNYLPARAAERFVRRFSARVRPEETWDDLLRGGIRGATRRELVHSLGHGAKPTVLRPSRLGARAEADIWYRVSMSRNPRKLKRVLRQIFKLGRVLGAGELVPILHLAIRKA